MKVESCNNNRLSRSVIEESYVAAIDTLNSISFALEDIKSVGQNDLSDVSFDKTLFDFESSYDENFGLQFKFSRLPNLKTSRGISRLAECFIIEIGEKILTIIPRGYQKMDDIDTIFVSHFLKNGHHQSHYFNNDNLAIKSILDAIVPLVCVDDATRYCDNFYLSQHDMNKFSELDVYKRQGLSKQGLRGDLRIGGAHVGQIHRLPASFQLRGKHRDRDGDQHGDDRDDDQHLHQCKTFAI